jgi:superfamily II DNA or RNA helicase
MSTSLRPTSTVPEVGQLALVRHRHWVVTSVEKSTLAPDVLSSSEEQPQHLVSLTSVEDDGADADVRVIWELEPGARPLEQATLPAPVPGRFDTPDRLDAFLDAVRWGAITSADSQALQAPYRAGISIEDYQLDPVVRALRMPRVNLLIADDVGLGKTVESGLVIQELLLRHRARTVWVVCPANLCLKWQAEMIEKFGLEFRVVDAEYVRELRRARGIAANPWTSFPRLIVSVDWLKRPRAMSMLREVLPHGVPTYPRRFDLLVIDEVHSVAPAGKGRYATDSLRTKAIREIAPHFEHRLFVSATPHNGYVESFTALLELLDPQRFARGVKPSSEALAHSVVRRLKSELRQTLPPKADGSPRFAERLIRPLVVEYPDEERRIHALLKRYAASRRTGAGSGAARVAADFVTLLLKKRLFSSPAAFAATLEVHRKTASRGTRAGEAGRASTPAALMAAVGRLDEEVVSETELDEATEDALGAAAAIADPLTPEQHEMLQEMTAWAETNRMRADAKAELLMQWLDETCRPRNRDGERVWNTERVIIFTEYRDTQRWLQTLLAAHGLGGDRLALLYGGMDADERERIKAEFQFDPTQKPLRILLATDAASEGIDLQRHCHRMVHVEIPFNPNRLEQRNGRIDRHGQRAPHVLIHHFVGKGFEDAEPGSFEGDLEFLSRVARRVTTIRDDLGSVGPVLAMQVEQAMLGDRRSLDERAVDEARGKASRALQRIERNLREEVQKLRAQLEESTKELRISPEAIARVVQVGLELGRQAPLTPTTIPNPEDSAHPLPAWVVPPLTKTWARTITDLVHPVTGKQRPITFDHAAATGREDDVVLVHLGHRLVDQAMRLLRAEIWKGAMGGTAGSAAATLTRVTARVVPGSTLTTPAVVAHARLVVTGSDGHRLHEEVITAGGLVRDGRFARFETRSALDGALGAATDVLPDPSSTDALVASWPSFSDAVYRAVEARAKERTESLSRLLAARAESDAQAITSVMQELQKTITGQLDDLERDPEAQAQLTLFETDERQQFSRDVEALRRRLDEIPDEIDREVRAVRSRYEHPTHRLFPAAVTFLMPETMVRSGGSQ